MGIRRNAAFPESGARVEGAALVEFALLLPLLLMIAIGLISSGIAFNHKVSLTHAARETGRYGATLPVSTFLGEPSPIEAWLDSLGTRAIENAGGSLDPGAPAFFTCVAFVHPNGAVVNDRTRSRTETPAGTVAYSGEPCFVDGRPDDERRVQVRVERETDFTAVVFRRTITLTSDSATKFEVPGL